MVNVFEGLWPHCWFGKQLSGLVSREGRVSSPPDVVFSKLLDHKNFSDSCSITHDQPHPRPIKADFAGDGAQD